jgi:GAF domain-containing protein
VLELDRLLDIAARLVQETFAHHHVGLFILDPERGELVIKARAGDYGDLLPPDHRIKLGQGMVGWVGRHKETLLANDVEAEQRYANFFPDVIPTRSELSVPICTGKEIVGVLDAQSPQLNAFDDNDVLVMETLADQLAVAIESARLYESAQHELAERRRAEEKLRQTVAELERTNAELEQFNRSAVGRELRMIELKRQVNEVYELLGKEPPYDVSFAEEIMGGE